jgi:hypothetical protein
VQNSWLICSTTLLNYSAQLLCAAAPWAAVEMDLANAGKLLLVAGIAILTFLWLLDKFVPSLSPSRLQARYGLRQEYPAPEKPAPSAHSIDERVSTRYISMIMQHPLDY